ncbi:MAG: hypothetical protein HUU02_16985 [Bacteroidetes bacterium]|nr:hypothetical protein [Bacteroidota bacterium]
MSFSLFQTKRPEQKFWDWFLRNQRSLFHFEKDQETVFRELAATMARVDGHLRFEFGPVTDGKREFVISAGGIKDAFPAVLSLASAAPPLDLWTVTPFRPRRTDISSVQIGPFTVDPKDVMFTMTPNDHMVDITLYFGATMHYDRELHGHIGFLLLDESLGEFDVEMLVGMVDFVPATVPSVHTKYPLRDLPKMFDELVKKISN